MADHAPGTTGEREIKRFIGALFPRANDGYVKMTVFQGGRTALLEQPRAGGPAHWRMAPAAKPEDVERIAANVAREAGKLSKRKGSDANFCPPVATFTKGDGTKERALVQGVALSVDLDERPDSGQAKLEAVLGTPTVVVHTGGVWADPETGEVQDKRHLHWRLTKPTRSGDEHDRLKEARRLAVKLAGGDGSSAPVVHPLRWPGSWHMKDPSRPVMAHIAGGDDSTEIDLDSALQALREAVPGERTAASRHEDRDGRRGVVLRDYAESRRLETALRFIDPSGYEPWIRVGQALHHAFDGDEKGRALWNAWSGGAFTEEGDCPAYSGPDEIERKWRSFGSRRDPVTINTVYDMARQAGWTGHAEAATVFSAVGVPGAAENRARTQLELAKLQAGLPTSDAGNAERLQASFGGVLRFCPEAGRWLQWTGERWAWCTAQEEELYALESIRAIAAEATLTDDSDRRGQLLSHAMRSESHQKIKAAVARTQPLLPKNIQELDADPWLLAVRNGTLDLRTGELREHRAEDFLTRQLGIDYNPGAEAPAFQAFLERVQPDEEIRRFLQRAAGVTLIGEPIEQALIFNFGRGANGKTTFLEALGNVLRPFVERVPAWVLMTQGEQQREQHVAKLHGARMVIASEIAEGQHLAESFLKDLTGGDSLTGKEVYRTPFSFKPSHTLWLYGNHRPSISGGDHGIWRRILLVPWQEVISDEEKDPQLPEKLRGEAEGIFSWMVQGAQDYLREKSLRPPRRVQVAVEEYQRDMDVIGQFLEDRTIPDPDGMVSAGELQADYEAWSRENGLRPKRGRGFGDALKARGYRQHRTGKGRFWVGLRLAPPTAFAPGGWGDDKDRPGAADSAESLLE